MVRIAQVFTAQTGNATSSTFSGGPNLTAHLALTYGSTPTATFALQGSNDGGTTWESVVCVDDAVTTQTKATTFVYTTGTPQAIVQANTSVYGLYRINLTANTNVTVSAWLSASV